MSAAALERIRAWRHVLHRLRGDLGGVGGLQPPLGLGGLPLGELHILIIGITAQRARGGPGTVT